MQRKIVTCVLTLAALLFSGCATGRLWNSSGSTQERINVTRIIGYYLDEDRMAVGLVTSDDRAIIFLADADNANRLGEIELFANSILRHLQADRTFPRLYDTAGLKQGRLYLESGRDYWRYVFSSEGNRLTATENRYLYVTRRDNEFWQKSVNEISSGIPGESEIRKLPAAFAEEYVVMHEYVAEPRSFLLEFPVKTAATLPALTIDSIRSSPYVAAFTIMMAFIILLESAPLDTG